IEAAAGGAAAAILEGLRQYASSGHIDDWGRVRAAAAGGAVFGAVCALNPVEGIHVFVTGARAGVAAGLTERLVASGGKDAGTLGDAALDAPKGVASLIF